MNDDEGSSDLGYGQVDSRKEIKRKSVTQAHSRSMVDEQCISPVA